MGIIQKIESGVKRAGSSVKNAGNTIRSNIQSKVGEVGASINSAIDGKQVFVDLNNLGDINAAIDNYVKDLDDVLKDFESKDPTSAFKGKYTDAIVEFNKSLKEACHNLVTNIRYFQQALNDAAAKYNESQTSLQSTISSTASEILSSTNETESVSYNGGN